MHNIDLEKIKQSDDRRLMLYDPLSERTQRNHFLVLSVFPIPLSLIAFLWYPPSRSDLIVLAFFWFLTSLGIACGNHRYLSHKAFVPVKRLKQFLVIAGSMAGQGPPVLWAAFHRRHHQCADKEGDPHSPNMHGASLFGRIRGVFHASFSWMKRHEYPNPMIFASDLVRDPDIQSVNKHYYRWVALAMLIPAAIGFITTGTVTGTMSGFLWGWGVRALILNSVIGYINSFNHLIGKREFTTRDGSRNQWWMTLVTLGESWHNNHHAFPGSAHAGLRSGSFDVAYGIVRFWALCGWVSKVNVPSKERIEAKRVEDAAAREPA